MKEKFFLDKFIEKDAILDGHFVLNSRRHTNICIDEYIVTLYTWYIREICKELVPKFIDLGTIDTVIGPTVFAWPFADRLNGSIPTCVLGMCIDKSEDGFFKIRKNLQKYITGKKIIVADVVLDSGNTVRKLIQIVQEIGGEVVAVGALFDRGGLSNEDIGVPKFASYFDRKLLEGHIQLNDWDATDCPLCEQRSQ